MTAETVGTWDWVFQEQEVEDYKSRSPEIQSMEDDTSDTTSQSLKSRSPEIQSSNGDETESTQASSEPRRRLHATLNKEQAAAIYMLRPWQKDSPYPKHVAAGNSQLLAKCFGVTPKAVRDVWNRRTWAHATGKHVSASVLDALPMLQQLEKARSDVVVRRPGRPIGSKDAAPRRRGATKVPANLVLDKRATKAGKQTGMSREAVQAAMAEHLHATERMEEHGGSQSELPADSCSESAGGSGSWRSPPSEQGHALYPNGSSHSPPSDGGGSASAASTMRGSASAASMAASANAQQLAAAAWNMCEVPSPDGQDRERLRWSPVWPAVLSPGVSSGGGSPGGGSPDTRPCLLSAADVALQLNHVYQRQEHQRQHQHQHQHQQRGDDSRARPSGDTPPCVPSRRPSYT
ncbi:hypothetical protein T484DRAFT_3644067, partial [Baffinella frigidus]